MNFKCELTEIDYQDQNLIKALDTISDDILYTVEITTDEMEEIVNKFLIDNLGIDLEASEMTLSLTDKELTFSNLFEAAVNINILIKYYGSNIVYPPERQNQGYYKINDMVFVKKMCKFGLVNRNHNTYEIKFNQSDEFVCTWFYHYLTQNKEEI